MAKVFAWMRPNDLIWSYFVNNYLLGKNPGVRHPLLEQRQHAPARCAAWRPAGFLQAQPAHPPGRPGVCGTPIDLQKVTVDSFSVAGINDHITRGTRCIARRCCSG
jgi:polyhydroxyalkanoate synthase